MRLVLEGKATYDAMERYWSINDVILVNEALDAWQEAEVEARKLAERK